MNHSTWGRWLSALLRSDSAAKRRLTAVSRHLSCEALERRTLLASNPIVVNGSGSPQEDLAFPGTVATLAFDLDGDPLTFSVVSPPTHGTLVLAAAGTFTYTPNLNYNGPDSFTFKANDGNADSNVGTYALNISPVEDPLRLVMPSAQVQVARNSSPFRIDPAATVSDADTVINYANTQIRATIYQGNTNGDNQKGRVILLVRSQPPAPGVVSVNGGNIYFGTDVTNPVAKFSGGKLGRSLVITFTKNGTFAQVNAVLQQISMQASVKATLGVRSMQVAVYAGGQSAFAPKLATII